MPNWCENRVRLSDNGDNSEQFDRLVKLLDGPDPFNAIFPRPDFPNIPNSKGELPIKEEIKNDKGEVVAETYNFPDCLLYTSPSPRDLSTSRMPSSA